MVAQRKAHTFTVATVERRGVWLARVAGACENYGLSREFITPSAARKAYPGLLVDYELTKPGLYESSQLLDWQGQVVQMRFYHRLSSEFDTASQVSAVEVFKEISAPQATFGWPCWFGRMFSPHLETPLVEVRGKGGVGERWHLVRDGRIDLFLTMAVPLYFERDDCSYIQLCPIERLADEGGAHIAITSHSLGDRMTCRDLIPRLPRGDWGGQDAAA